uniref:Bm7822 n=1 Tax=Brugia malayi TaxID=6279 RepID=A0A1I9GDY8_BRUMA|nr:Bm7822 [Brugia malayi]
MKIEYSSMISLLYSWNSIRWNKPLESSGGTIGSRYCSRFMPFSESKDYSTPPLGHIGLQSTSKNNIELKNSGPYIRERSVRFGDSVLSVMNDKTSTRISPRLPWLPDNYYDKDIISVTNRRNTTYNTVTRNPRENSFTANSSSSSRWTTPSFSTTRSFQSGIRNTVPASSSSATTSLHDKPFLSNTSQTISNNHGNASLKTADRPWRRRMADAARLRIVHGDEIGGAVHSTLATMRARRSSIPNGRNCTSNGSDELRTTLKALKNYIDEQTTGFYRQNNRFSARNSPIFNDKLSFDNSMITFKQQTPIRNFYSNRWNSGRFSEHMSRDMLLRPLRFNDNNLHENAVNSINPVARNSSIPESICERESNSRLLSSKERNYDKDTISVTNRRNTAYNTVTRNPRENSFTANSISSSRWTSPSFSTTRSFQSGIRNTVPASSSSATTSLHDKPFLNRPWRRRMADAARLRIVHGDEIGGAVHSTLATMRARRSSIPNGRNCTSNGSDELRTTLKALKNYIDEQTTGFYRQNNRFSARNSPIFNDKLSFDNSMITFKQQTPIRNFYSNRWNSGRFSEYMSRDMLLRPLRFNDNNLHENAVNSINPVARNSSIPESICERESNSRLLSSKERTLRYQSRQRKLEIETNSSSDNEQQSNEIRKRKLRKRLKKKCCNDNGK